MRVQKFSLLAIAVAVGLSLTGCQGDDSAGGASDSSGSERKSGSKKSSDDSASAGKSDDAEQTGASSGGSANGSAKDGAKTGSSACRTSQLAFSSSPGMGEGTLIVHMENTGSAVCVLKGFPGADLKSKDGTVSATRSDRDAPRVSVEPGEETRFTLNYPPNHSGGSGVKYTELVVTPPNETHSHTLPVEISVPVTDGSGTAVKVHPVGTGK